MPTTSVREIERKRRMSVRLSITTLTPGHATFVLAKPAFRFAPGGEP
jgi:hypothetical protein